MDRRAFVGLMTVGAGMLAARSAGAQERLRILPGPEAAGRFSFPGDPGPELPALLASLRVEDGRAHGALRVFWLRGAPPPPRLAVATLDEARGRGDLRLTEREEATVPSILVDNRGKVHVLLLAGEILLGGKQDRVLAEDVLLPPRSGPRPVPVYCVEQGRWVERSAQFQSKGGFAAPGLRSEVMAAAPQARVWAEVRRYREQAAAPSPTASYDAIRESPAVQAHQESVALALDPRPPAGAQGAAVFLGEAFAGLDVFQDATLLAREWPKLLRAHALETYGRPPVTPGDGARLRHRLADLLGRGARSQGWRRPGAGTGWIVEFQLPDARGSALVAEGQVVHAAIL
jgi:hypothetical protein